MANIRPMTEDRLIYSIITGLLTLITIEAGIFAFLGWSGILPNLAGGSQALTIIATVTGFSAIIGFFFTRRA